MVLTAALMQALRVGAPSRACDILFEYSSNQLLHEMVGSGVFRVPPTGVMFETTTFAAAPLRICTLVPAEAAAREAVAVDPAIKIQLASFTLSFEEEAMYAAYAPVPDHVVQMRAPSIVRMP